MARQSVNTKPAHSFFPLWVQQRELRHRLPIVHSDALYKTLYTSLSSTTHSGYGGGRSGSEHDGLRCLEFSPDGTHLIAVSGKSTFLMFDPLTRRLISPVLNAHTGCVTLIKFLNSRIFAAGGDNGEIFLWDTRNLKSRFITLPGHSELISNIEISRKNEMLITSEFDGINYIWDMKTWNHLEEHRSSFMSHSLQRLRLNPDETKMIISTAHGYLLIVHELDLNTLVRDLMRFELETFVIDYFQQRNTNWGQNSNWYLSQNRRRNRVEIVADFPNADGNISALEIHPQGWSAFSRSKSEISGEEWTCVHDIQERELCAGGALPREESGDRAPPCPQRLEAVNGERRSTRGESGSFGRGNAGFRIGSSNDSGSQLPNASIPLGRGGRERRFSFSVDDAAREKDLPPRPSSTPPRLLEQTGLDGNPPAVRVLDHLLPRLNPNVAQFNCRVHGRCPRLTHYIEESYSSEWYIESLGVSADGRLVCSPSERGIRLLAFSPECSEQSVSGCGTISRRLHEFSRYTLHRDIVVSAKFSPRHCLLVSGGLDGKIVWYQPVV